MLFEYKALDASGARKHGRIDAGSAPDARSLLRERLLVPIKVVALATSKAGKHSPGGAWSDTSTSKLEFLIQITRQLHLLLRSGIPLVEAMDLISSQMKSQKYRGLLENLASAVREGASFPDSLEQNPAFFPPLCVHVVRSGVHAGELPAVLAQLSKHYSRQKRIRQRVISALTYPLIMVVVGVFVLIFLMTFVVPRIASVIQDQKHTLPWLTETLLDTSDFVSRFWPMVAIAIGIVIAGSRILSRRPWAQGWRDKALLLIPLVGPLLRRQIVARWAQTMSTLLGSGTPLSEALSVARGALGNRVFVAASLRLEELVTAGGRLGEAMKGSRVFPIAVAAIVAVGEESGELPELLKETADSHEFDMDVSAERLTQALGPVLITILGLCVGLIMAAILLPMAEL